MNVIFKSKFHSHLHTLYLYFGPGHILMIFFFNFNNEVVDLIYSGMEHDSGNVFHMFAPKPLNSYFQTLLYFEHGCIDMLFTSNIW